VVCGWIAGFACFAAILRGGTVAKAPIAKILLKCADGARRRENKNPGRAKRPGLSN